MFLLRLLLGTVFLLQILSMSGMGVSWMQTVSVGLALLMFLVISLKKIPIVYYIVVAVSVAGQYFLSLRGLSLIGLMVLVIICSYPLGYRRVVQVHVVAMTISFIILYFCSLLGIVTMYQITNEGTFLLLGFNNPNTLCSMIVFFMVECTILYENFVKLRYQRGLRLADFLVITVLFSVAIYEFLASYDYKAGAYVLVAFLVCVFVGLDNIGELLSGSVGKVYLIFLPLVLALISFYIALNPEIFMPYNDVFTQRPELWSEFIQQWQPEILGPVTTSNVVPLDGMYISTFYHWGILPAALLIFLITGAIISVQHNKEKSGWLIGILIISFLGFSENIPRFFFLAPMLFFWIIGENGPKWYDSKSV